ncbi:hypothetical protein KJ032_26815, partial [Salmonella enterica subsp. enterica serovar Typhimurium]|nr:hypothetical protein [Salmonella enterica subsp. enterica serovar Typhimurium]
MLPASLPRETFPRFTPSATRLSWAAPCLILFFSLTAANPRCLKAALLLSLLSVSPPLTYSFDCPFILLFLDFFILLLS